MEVSGSDLGSELDYYVGVRDLFQPSDKVPGNNSVSIKKLPSKLLPIHYPLTGLSFVAVYIHVHIYTYIIAKCPYINLK